MWGEGGNYFIGVYIGVGVWICLENINWELFCILVINYCLWCIGNCLGDVFF